MNEEGRARYVVVYEAEARERGLSGYDRPAGRWQSDDNYALFRCDDAGTPVECIATDQMEPEDANFLRDLSWVVVLLNEQDRALAAAQAEGEAAGKRQAEARVAALERALREYANPLNWTLLDGIRRIWLEPGSATPEAYNGFELARAALSAPSQPEAGPSEGEEER